MEPTLSQGHWSSTQLIGFLKSIQNIYCNAFHLSCAQIASAIRVSLYDFDLSTDPGTIPDNSRWFPARINHNQPFNTEHSKDTQETFKNALPNIHKVAIKIMYPLTFGWKQCFYFGKVC